jgi:hypothetical protein
MKKILLVLAIFAVARLNAQIVNPGFENWATETSHFTGFPGVVPGDTTLTYSDPIGWTSTNSVTGDTALGGLILVTQSNVAHSGSSSVQLFTDTLKTISISGVSRQLTVPGLVLNGVFPVAAITSSFTSISASSINPGKVSGAGQPFTQLLDSFTGYYQYTPVFNTATQSMDTCVMWATLRKGSTIIANAIFKSQDSTHGQWASFSAAFVYLNCETPDTLVVLLASSVPNFSGLLSGTSDLTMGSVLLVDDLSYDTLVAGTNFVFAKNDVATVNRGTTDTIDVLVNDTSCNGSALTVTITTPPNHGTATVLANNKISYTANTTYYGLDTLYYTDKDPNNVTSTASVIITVDYGVNISEANEIPVKMYPVPASDNLHVEFVNNGKTTARIFDVVGNLISVSTFTQNDNNINVSNFTNGVYGLQLLDENSNIIARTKFVVNK